MHNSICLTQKITKAKIMNVKKRGANMAPEKYIQNQETLTQLPSVKYNNAEISVHL